MKTRSALVLYVVVVGSLALMLSWWAVFFVRQGGVLVERAERAGAALSPAQAAAVREAAHTSLRMFLFEGAFLLLLFGAGVVLMLRALRREVRLARQQQDFLSAVTHELRTPLASARLALQSLALGRVSAEKRPRYLAGAEADLARLSELVERVLESARVAGARPRLALQDLDLAEFVETRAAALASEVAAALTLELDTHGPATIRAEPAALAMILRNLLANAAKYAAQPGRVRLTVARGEREARLLVRDFGPGLAHAPERLFEAFTRGSGPLERSRPGVGLGLYLVSELVRAQAGRIEARNAAGGGLEIELRFPLTMESA